MTDFTFSDMKQLLSGGPWIREDAPAPLKKEVDLAVEVLMEKVYNLDFDYEKLDLGALDSIHLMMEMAFHIFYNKGYNEGTCRIYGLPRQEK